MQLYLIQATIKNKNIEAIISADSLHRAEEIFNQRFGKKVNICSIKRLTDEGIIMVKEFYTQ